MSKIYTTTVTSALEAACESTSFFEPRFVDIVANLQSSLEEEVWFDDTDYDPAFDWTADADAVWHALAEDADDLTAQPPKNSDDLALHRMSRLIARAIRSTSLIELCDVLSRSALCLDHAKRLRSSEIYYLLADAHECLDRMACLAGAQAVEEAASGFSWSQPLAA